MKTLVHILPIVTALSLSLTPGSRAEETRNPPVAQSIEDFRRYFSADSEFADMEKQFKQAAAQFDEQMAQAGETFRKQVPSAPPEPYGYGYGWENPFERRTGVARAYGRSGSGSSSKALVVRSTESDAGSQANLEEDLTVMLRVLDKATEETRGNKSGRTVMGINVFFSSSQGPSRSLYLDGYGALFLMKVDMPLIAPPVVKEEAKEKTPADSNWEEARREVFGSPGDVHAPLKDAEEYDAEKVAKLKNDLLEALRSATNIRNLKADDSITVCVFGGAGQRVIERKSSGPVVKTDVKVSPVEISIHNSPGRGSILTLKAKKSDIDAFGKGKLNLDEFRKKVSMTTYQGAATEQWF